MIKPKKLTIAVLMGGISPEREISLASGKNVVKGLRSLKKYKILVYDPKFELKKLIEDKNKIDLVMPILHGPFGEDGTIQGFLELLQIPYAFSSILASALGMNKVVSRRILEKANIPVPKYISIEKGDKNREKKITQISNLLLKSGVVTKPNNQGSSVGVNICRNKKELKKGLKEAFYYDKTVLIEKYIKGLEITVGVLDNEDLIALPVVEIHPQEEFFNYKAKYDPKTKEIVPAKISQDLAKKAQKLALNVYRLLGCQGTARVDMIAEGKEPEVRKKGKIYVLEINTIPGLTKESLIPKAAKACGINFPKLLDKLIKKALEEKIV